MSAPESIRARRQQLASVSPAVWSHGPGRRVRCDRSEPCSNCRASGIACQQATLRLDTSPKAADRITQLRRHVALLEDRLSTFERQRKDSVVTTSPSSSSFATLSAEAGEAVQSSTLSNGSNTARNVDESFRNLNNLIHIESTASSLSDHYFSLVPSRQLTSLREALPVALVVSILRKLKAHGSIFLHGYMISDVTLIEDICRRVCFPTDPVSTSLVNSMHGLLYILLRECLILGDPLGKEYDLKEYAAHCGRNFNTGIQTYDILAVPSFENVSSLTLGVVKAQNEAKLFLARTLASAAASHCHILGYHRETLYHVDRTAVSHTIRGLFWSLYMFDKNMSLLLGCSSSFQDIEIDTQYPLLSTDPGRKPWDEWFHLAIRLAKVQGQIYDRLYSATGIQMEVSERNCYIESLEATLHYWRNDLEQIDSTHVNYPEVFNLSRAHWDIMNYSTLTCLLIVRASANPRFDGEIGFRSIFFCFSRYNSSNMLSDADFANWVLHTSSFTPFIVLFLHAIAATSIKDLDLLDKVVQTLRSTRQAGKPFEQLHEICATFARLAQHPVEEGEPGVGSYNSCADSLQLTRESNLMSVYWLESLRNLDVMEHFVANMSSVNSGHG
ncbi:hypothetical protein GGR58DRAFT_518364 [Xylaria digitata]|nr:hypothetical protein GGR58DRAFT_518364 [Xylaria digitata]